MKTWLLFCLLVSFGAYCQQDGRMETDRPDQTECPYIVKKGFLQAEMGFNKNHEWIGAHYNLPSTLWKYGLAKWIELRYVNNIKMDPNITFLHEAVGFKIKVLEASKYTPLTSIIVHYNLGDDKRDVSDKNTEPHSIGQAVVTLQHDVYKELGMGYNFGFELHDNGRMEGIYRISPGLNLSKKWYAYAEVFGRFPTSNVADHWYDGGFAYYLTDHVKADISAGRSFTASTEWYLALGLSFRVRLKKAKTP